MTAPPTEKPIKKTKSPKKSVPKTPKAVGAVVRDIRNDEGDVVRSVTVLQLIVGPKGGRAQCILTDDGADYVRNRASIGSTQEEIAAGLGVDTDTLNNSNNAEKFRAALNLGNSDFLTMIRDSQSRIAKGGNAQMSIFLGKNYLGQQDRIEAAVSVKDESKADAMTYDQVMDLLNRKTGKDPQ